MPQPVKTTVVQVKPRNVFNVLADSDSEDSSPRSPVVSPVAPVAVAPVAPAPEEYPYAPCTPPYAPVTPPFGPTPIAVAPVVAPQGPKARRKGKIIHHVSEDGWVSIRSSGPTVSNAPQFVLEEPEIEYEKRTVSPSIASEDEIEITPLAPPQNFPSLLTRGRIPNRDIVLEGKIDGSDEASARAWAEKISKSLKDAEANRGLSFFRRG